MALLLSHDSIDLGDQRVDFGPIEIRASATLSDHAGRRFEEVRVLIRIAQNAQDRNVASTDLPRIPIAAAVRLMALTGSVLMWRHVHAARLTRSI